MSYEDKIRKIVDNLDLGKPVFTIKLGSRGQYIQLNEQDWNPSWNSTNFIENLASQYIRRQFDSHNKKYYVNVDDLSERIGEYCIDYVDHIFTECSPYDQPRRTNVYRDFIEVVRRNKNHTEFKKALFDIHEYYFNQTLTESITHPKNDVHRKNIYHLLCLMEKSYGKKASN